MGGQACVLYGGAEFSRDTDLVLLGSDENLDRLRAALIELNAETIAVPPFDKQFLEEGLSVHFRCQHPEAAGMRIDIMTRLRGMEEFSRLWERRVTFDLDGEQVDVLCLPDLIRAKKTQRDKDWVMIRRLVEATYYRQGSAPSPQHIEFFFRELRTPALLIEVAQQFPVVCQQILSQRPLLSAALDRDEAAVEQELHEEEQRERDLDRTYWIPLRRRIEELRRDRLRGDA